MRMKDLCWANFSLPSPLPLLFQFFSCVIQLSEEIHGMTRITRMAEEDIQRRIRTSSGFSLWVKGLEFIRSNRETAVFFASPVVVLTEI
jgi:hypothetical protein